MLQTLRTNESFKETFFDMLSGNLEGCGDRSGMLFNELFVAWKLATLDPQAPAAERLHLITQAAKTVTLRKSLQRRIALQEARSRQPIGESVQIFLYYESHLRESLDLLSFINKMLYPSMGRCSWIDNDELIEEVNSNYLEEMIGIPSLVSLRDSDPDFTASWQEYDEDIGNRILALEAIKDTMESRTFMKEYRRLEKDRETALNDKTMKWLRTKLFH